MSRRGRSGPTISLFSFQDIITSVTAIVTVIALLLALDLVQRKQSQSGETSASIALELIAALERAEAEFARLSVLAESTDELVKEVAATSPAELKNEIAQRESTIAELERERARLEQQNQKWRSREKEVLGEQFDLEPLKEEQVRTERTAKEVQRQSAEERTENRTIFSLPRGTTKEGWVAVIDSDQISVAPLERPEKPTTFVSSGLLLLSVSATGHFEKWIDERQLGSAYFLLLIRPDGAKPFDDVRRMMERKTISHGFDLAGADQTLLHPERGASR